MQRNEGNTHLLNKSSSRDTRAQEELLGSLKEREKLVAEFRTDTEKKNKTVTG